MTEDLKKKPKNFIDWMSPEDPLPKPFELCMLLFDEDSTQPGWFTGTVWEYRKKDDGKKVIAWKYQVTPH